MSKVTGFKKTENVKEYNRVYMNNYYKHNPIKMRLSRNSNRLKKLQHIDPESVAKFGFQLSHVVKISKLFRELSPEMRDIVKNELSELNFDNIDYKV